MMDWINVIHSIAGLLASESRDIYRAISNLKNECEKRRRPAYHGSANAVDEELALKLVTYDLYLDALRGRRVKLSRVMQ
uniref:Uncharacterized protein n=1 Tax=Romanomermis culicivorax TaxID=13658 RepID=A0A915I9K2_ROMCU